ncbi:MAG: hypothetical protein SGI77_00685 [Pirellulaceae bacterium]|nr:hypothetical protein [Pirellulaceae bacterium]
MSSPFDFFRKNQRAWMAALVVVSIVAFVIIPNVDDNLRPGGQTRRNSQTMVSWKGGHIDADGLQKLQVVQNQTYRVFAQMATEVLQAGGTPNVPGFSFGQGGMEIGLERPGDAQSILQVRLLAEAAKQRGVIVDDKTVDQFILNFSDKRIPQKRFAEIIRENGGESLNKFDMYNYLRDEIAKQIMVQLGYSALAFTNQSIVTPSKNWLNFQKFQQRAKIEAYPVFVDQYLAKVTAKPSEQELRTLYNEGKDRIVPPNSPEPGFRRPYRANLEFVLADLAVFLKEEEAKISDDLLKETYDKRVAEGGFKVPVEEFKPTEPDKPTTDKPTTDESKADESAKDAEVKPVDPPATTEPEATKEPAPSDASFNGSKTNAAVRLIAFQDEPAEKAAADADAKPEPPAEVTVKNEAAPKAEVATQAETENIPVATTTSPIEVGAEPKEAEKPMRVKSFDEVREEIRRELSSEPAHQKMQAATSAVREAMEAYNNQLQLFKSGDPKNPDTIEPPPLSLPELADKYGLSYGKTGMVDPFTAQSLSIGRSFVRTGSGQFGFASFAEFAISNRLKLFQASSSFQINQSEFVFWKIEEAGTRIPAFDEVRDEVAAAWNLAEARKLATKAAEELAGSINTSTDADPWARILDANLREFVTRPPTFTWLRPILSANDGIQLSMIEGIDQAGQVFMEKAFTTPLGKSAIAMDDSQQKCFVIRVLERTPSDEQLRAEFEKAPLSGGVRSLAMQQTSLSASRWFESVLKDMAIDTSNLTTVEESTQE